MTNHLVQYPGISVYYCNDLQTKLHAHHALEVVVASEGLLTHHGTQQLKSEGFMVRPNALHALTGKGHVVSIFLNPETALGSELVSMLGRRDIVKLEPTVTRVLIDYFNHRDNYHLSENGICQTLARSIVSDNHSQRYDVYPLDQRIARVIDLIKSSPQKSVPLKAMLKTSSLSESRLMHLFKQETGATIRKFVLWEKLQQAIKLHLAGNSLSRAAKLSGFTDGAHFNRVFVSMFGINPSSMLKKAA